MPDPTYIGCPRCGEPVAMSAMQKRLYIGRTLTCQRCAKPFAITEETPDPVPAPAVPVSSILPEPLAVEPVAQPQPRLQRKPGEGITAGRMALLIAIVGTVVTYLLYLAIAPSVHRSREAVRRVTCSSNLTQIGAALQVYANSNGGRFPDGLDSLVQGGLLPPELLVCPSSTNTAASGQTPAEQAANLVKGNHLSYVYLGKGLTFAAAKQVLAYESLAHHDNEGINVLYTDGTVQFLPRAAALVAVPQLGPPGSSTRPATSMPSR
jgi:hypothetical protein